MATKITSLRGSPGAKGDKGDPGDPLSVLTAYPVGSLFFTTAGTAPSFGGTWTAYAGATIEWQPPGSLPPPAYSLTTATAWGAQALPVIGGSTIGAWTLTRTGSNTSFSTGSTTYFLNSGLGVIPEQYRPPFGQVITFQIDSNLLLNMDKDSNGEFTGNLSIVALSTVSMPTGASIQIPQVSWGDDPLPPPQRIAANIWERKA